MAALGADEHGDILGRWMAHRVAELIERSETSGSPALAEKAKQDATRVILQLWQHRSHWPNGWPPSAASAFTDQFAERPVREAVPPTGSPWLDRLARLDAIVAEEDLWWRYAALLDLDEDPPSEVLLEEADDNERWIIETLATQTALAHRNVARLLDGDAVEGRGRAERGRAIASQLEDLARERALLLQQVVEHLDSPPIVPTPALARRKRRPR